MRIELSVETYPLPEVKGIELHIDVFPNWSGHLSYVKKFFPDEFISDWDRIAEEIRLLFKQHYLEEIRKEVRKCI